MFKYYYYLCIIKCIKIVILVMYRVNVFCWKDKLEY